MVDFQRGPRASSKRVWTGFASGANGRRDLSP
jgi:hypothetical protein